MKENKKPTIYTVATAHLDTVWNWDFETTVRKYIPATLRKNFRLFEKYPDYVFSFEGSRRYELMEEYYPEDFEKLRRYIAANRWFVAGSAYENGDVNVPSPEALFRNILYGNHYFLEKFGKTSLDIYLPDCFGFGYSLPSIIKHAGLLGFTTQKLTWSSAYGIPFDLGLWQGVDGSRVYASLDAQEYSASLNEVRKHKNAPNKLEKNIREYDLPMTYLLHGVGDRGGAPKEKSVKTVVAEKQKNAQETVQVELTSTDGVFRIMEDELSAQDKKKLPVWNNELVSTDHGVGGYTSRALGKRLNKQNEQLADAAERFSAAAAWLGAADYPQNVLDTAWKRVIAHQFHDDLPGTSLARVYRRSWNDYTLSLNQFAGVYESAVKSLARQMQIPFKRGITVAVANPTGFAREGAVAYRVSLPAGTAYVHVKTAAGKAVPSQLNADGTVVFTASVPANGIAVYCITPANKPYTADTGLHVTERTLENRKYKVTLDDNGDIVSVLDKALQKELLKAPVCMALHKYNGSKPWPAWELDYKEVMAPPVDFARAPQFTITEDGSARVSIVTRRTAGKSVFFQRISLGEQDETVRVDNEIFWNSRRTLLKTPFTLAVENEQASYDLGLGFIRRGTNTPKLYEVPAQNWADISGKDYGVSILSDCKYGWDHPTADTLRLTGLHTPRFGFLPDSHQDQLDLGRNRYAFGIFSHESDNLAATQAAGMEFCQPLRAFTVRADHDGILPPEYAFAEVTNTAVLLRAIKKAQDSEQLVVRVNEGTGAKQSDVHLRIGSGIRKAWLCNAQEQPLKALRVQKGELVFDIEPFAPMTFLVELKPFGKTADVAQQIPIRLPYNLSATSPNSNRKDGALGGYSIPEELFPRKINCKGINFTLSDSTPNALRCCGQTLLLPEGTKAVALVLTSTQEDRPITFPNGIQVQVPDCLEALGAGDLYDGKHKYTAYRKLNTLAYEFTHMHKDGADEIAKQAYLFFEKIPVKESRLTLPVAENILVFAATAIVE